jgi:hypothetical protein
MINNNDVSIGADVEFKTFNPIHNITITGRVEGVCNATMARSISDIDNYNTQVLSSSVSNIELDRDNLMDINNQTFVIIRNTESLTAYSFDWIRDWTILSLVGDIKILIRNVDEVKTATVLALLLENGFSAKLIQ